LQFFHDLDLLAPVFPKATHTTTFDFDWIRNGDPTWFSTLWQTLCQNSTQAGFIKTLDKLASVLRSSIQVQINSLSAYDTIIGPNILQVSGVSATNDKLLQQSSIFILNIALPCLAQLEDPSQGKNSLKIRFFLLSGKIHFFGPRPKKLTGPVLNLIFADAKLICMIG
jgi:hypothetical protein